MIKVDNRTLISFEVGGGLSNSRGAQFHPKSARFVGFRWWYSHFGCGDHVGLKQLVEDMARYPYLPRLKNDEVLLEAVRDGVAKLTWQSETFAYAEAWDEAKNRYLGLAAGQQANIVLDASYTLLGSPALMIRESIMGARLLVGPPQHLPNQSNPIGSTVLWILTPLVSVVMPARSQKKWSSTLPGW